LYVDGMKTIASIKPAPARVQTFLFSPPISFSSYRRLLILYLF
jgi:hypothetical protein